MMWLILAASCLPLAVVIAGVRGQAPREMALAAIPLLFATLCFAGWMGWRARQQALADRERSASQAMILVIAAQLKSQDESTLHRIASAGGPAGEAAHWILKARSEKRSSQAATA
jgi:hypothetical protein